MNIMMICCVFYSSERDLGSFGERRGFDFLYTKNFARPRSDFTYTKNFARSGSDFIYTNRNAQNFLCAARGWGFFNDLMKIYEGRCDRKRVEKKAMGAMSVKMAVFKE